MTFSRTSRLLHPGSQVRVDWLTRAEAQTALDHDRVIGRVTAEAWSDVFDELGNPARWVAAGRVDILKMRKTTAEHNVRPQQ